jgi:hypothetical protein
VGNERETPLLKRPQKLDTQVLNDGGHGKPMSFLEEIAIARGKIILKNRDREAIHQIATG